MDFYQTFHTDLKSAWEVLLVFLIPVGAGIPGGVLLAKKFGLAWPMMMFIYLISDIILACIFEPCMLGFVYVGRRFHLFTKLLAAITKSSQNRTAVYGVRPGPVALILISFGVDPMTGRGVAMAAGHGFIAGWALAIAGDMMFFTLLMVSTLCLNNILGDGTWTAIIILVAMTVIPAGIRRWRRPRVPIS